MSLGKTHVIELDLVETEALQFERDVDEVVLNFRGIGV